jgi:hypothetical protein
MKFAIAVLLIATALVAGTQSTPVPQDDDVLSGDAPDVDNDISAALDGDGDDDEDLSFTSTGTRFPAKQPNAPPAEKKGTRQQPNAPPAEKKGTRQQPNAPPAENNWNEPKRNEPDPRHGLAETSTFHDVCCQKGYYGIKSQESCQPCPKGTTQLSNTNGGCGNLEKSSCKPCGVCQELNQVTMQCVPKKCSNPSQKCQETSKKGGIQAGKCH